MLVVCGRLALDSYLSCVSLLSAWRLKVPQHSNCPRKGSLNFSLHDRGHHGGLCVRRHSLWRMGSEYGQVCRGSGADCRRLCDFTSFSERPYEPYLVGSEARVLLVSSMSLSPTVFLPSPHSYI